MPSKAVYRVALAGIWKGVPTVEGGYSGGSGGGDGGVRCGSDHAHALYYTALTDACTMGQSLGHANQLKQSFRKARQTGNTSSTI